MTTNLAVNFMCYLVIGPPSMVPKLGAVEVERLHRVSKTDSDKPN